MRDGGGVDELAPLYLVLCHLDYFLEIREHAPRLCERRRRGFRPGRRAIRLPERRGRRVVPFREEIGWAWAARLASERGPSCGGVLSSSSCLAGQHTLMVNALRTLIHVPIKPMG